MLNVVNIKFLKELTSGILKIKSPYETIQDDYKPTYKELNEGKYFNKFVDNINPTFVIIGLKVNNHYKDDDFVYEKDVVLVYPKLTAIVIDSVNNIVPPCGAEIPLSTKAMFNIVNRTVEEETVTPKTGLITPLYRTTNKDFEIKNSKCIIDANLEETSREATLTATYIYSGSSHSSSVIMIQQPNKVSDWLFDYDTTDYINLTATPSIISSKGGKSYFKVIRTFTKHLYRTDSCGNKLDVSATTNNKEEITTLCRFDNTNPKYFVRDTNIINVLPQEYDANDRSAIITAHYKDLSDSVMIYQEKGGEVTYTYDLMFSENNETTLTKTLDTSLLTKINIPIISNKNMLIDGEIQSSIQFDNLKFVRDTWYNIFIDDSNEDIELIVEVIDVNHNRTNPRVSELIIKNGEDKNTYITLTLIQPPCAVIETKLELIAYGEGTYSIDTIKNAKIVLKPFRRFIYEDNTTRQQEGLDKGLKVAYEYTSTNDRVLKGGKLKQIDFNGTSVMKPIFSDNPYIDNVNLCVIGYIKDENGDYVAESNHSTLTLKGENIVTYTYSLCFDDDTKYKELVWDYDSTIKQQVKIKSFKYTYINGIENKCESVDVSINPINGWDDFTIRILPNNIIECNPFDINSGIDNEEGEYEVVQMGSDNKINLYLSQHSNSSNKNVKLVVDAHKKEINDNIWINDGGYVDILEEGKPFKTVPLNTCWLYPNIGDNSDIIYEGDIELKIGKMYKFITNNIRISTPLICGNPYKQTEIEVLIKPDTEEVKITIEL